MPILSDLPATTLRVTRWHDPTVDERGHEPRSAYVERFWLPVIGPTALWIYLRTTDALHAHPGGIDLDLADLAAQMGLAHRSDRTRPFDRALERIARFGLADRHGDGIAVRCSTPSVPRRFLERLPAHMARDHDRLVAPPIELDMMNRAHTLAGALVATGSSVEDLVRHLVAVDVPTTVARLVVASLTADAA